ncbi:ABC transporter substrate-binding protein [Amycolatopsis magusensis]|uniref:ABC transporter substrate-binding protein n=1 Tax=Amycolatopsis magusensis TaxID=882444 RepID=UPI001FD87DA5|nr:ABC transporter substrate-binding protein [Amycolatopsis magusensis]MDI5978910.1 ABC transporter substrate-binding protein [Amycolatopsis magusensis]
MGVLTATIGLLGSLSGCGLLGGSDDSAAEGNGPLEKSKIKVSIMPTIDVAPFHLANKNGYFKAEGLDVEIVNAPSGQASVTKLVNGEVDIAYGSYTPFFVVKSQGAADVRIIADASSAGPKSTMVVAMPSSTVKSVQDMAGKRVAITGRNTITDTLIKSVMKTNGVDFNGVQWVEFPFPEIAPALQRGDADAGFLTEPFITQASRTVGAVPVFDTAVGPTQDFPTAGYGTLGKFADENPKTAAAFQRVMQKATVEAADRSKIEPLLVEFAKVDPPTASQTGLLTFQSKLEAARLQRVPDILLEFGIISTKVSADDMIVKPAA